MCINQCLFDQKPAHTMAQKYNRSQFDVFSLNPYRLKQFTRFANECVPIPSVDRG
jgi:hypothetical protein